MAIGVRTPDAAVFGVNSLTPTIAAAQVTGDMMLLVAGGKPYDLGWSVATSGWASLGSGASGTTGAGIDLGSMKMEVWWKVATSDTETNPTVTEGSPTFNVAGAVVLVFSKDTGESWATPVVTFGADESDGTAISVTFGSDPGVQINDLIVTALAGNTDLLGPLTGDLTPAQASVTFGTTTQRIEQEDTAGGDMTLHVSTTPVSSGTGSAAPTATGTATASGTADRLEAAFIRLRVQVGITGAVTLPQLTPAGAVQGKVRIAGAVTVPSLTASAAVDVPIVEDNIAGAVTLPQLTPAGVAKSTERIAGTATLPSLTASAGVVGTVRIAGAVTLPALAAAAVVSVLTPVYHSSTTYVSNGGSTTCTLSVPPGADGDLLVAAVTAYSNRTITPPAGWTNFLTTTDATVFMQLLWYWRTAASEPASYDWTLDLSRDLAGVMVRIDKQYAAAPIDASGGQANTTVEALAPHGGITTATAHTLLLHIGVTTYDDVGGAATWTPPTGMTERHDITTTASPVSSEISLELCTETIASAGVTGARDATKSDATSRSLTGLVAIMSYWSDRATGAAAVPMLSAAGVTTTSERVTGAATLPSLTVAGAVTSVERVAASATLPSLTAAASVTGTVRVAGAATLPSLTAAGAVDVASTEVSIAGAASVPSLTAAASVTGTVRVSGAATLPSLAASAGVVGTVRVAAAATLAMLTVAASPISRERVASAATVPSLTAAASVVGTVRVAGAVTLPSLMASAAVVTQRLVTGTASVPSLTVAAVTRSTERIDGAATLPSLTAAATVSSAPVIGGSVTIPTLTAAGAVTGTVRVSGTAALPSLTAAGAVDVAADASAAGSVTLPSLTASATVIGLVRVLGTAQVPLLTVAGVAVGTERVTGTATIPRLTVTATATVITPIGALIAGAVTLPMLTVSSGVTVQTSQRWRYSARPPSTTTGTAQRWKQS